MMKIQLAGLSEGTHRYGFTVPVEDVGLGGDFAGDVVVGVLLEKSGTQFSVRASVSATGVFECDRCTVRFSAILTPTYRMHYLTEEDSAGRYDPAEVQVVSPSFSVIDLADDVRQTLLLGIPMKRLCREECRGLCPHCAKDLNESTCKCVEPVADSRWEQLRKLRST